MESVDFKERVLGRLIYETVETGGGKATVLKRLLNFEVTEEVF